MKIKLMILSVCITFLCIISVLLLQDGIINQVISNQLPSKKTSVTPKEVIISKDLSIVAIGDSLTEGIGDSSGRGGYLYFLEQQLKSQPNLRGITIENLGVKGRRTDQLIKSLKKEKMSAPIKTADIVLVTIGGNDLMKITKENFTDLTKDLFQIEQDNFRKNLHEIFSIINGYNKNTDIYLIGMYNPFLVWLEELNELEEIISEWNAIGLDVALTYSNGYYIPINDIFAENTNNLLAEDNFHPNEKGYELMANRIIDYLGFYNFNSNIIEEIDLRSTRNIEKTISDIRIYKP
jgi:lysophospholipase L1-like esterase